jgi:TRAP-type uncharacterized transport system fused permease subunit
MRRARDAVRAEPWHYLVSLWLLVAMLLAYVVEGRSSGVFVVIILVTICWFVLYGVAMGCLLLARAEARFWDWFVRQTT